MKINFNVECTPDEARSFFGLPKVAPMQDRMLKEMEAQFRKSMASMDGEALFKGFLAGTGNPMERWQELFRSALKTGSGAG